MRARDRERRSKCEGFCIMTEAQEPDYISLLSRSHSAPSTVSANPAQS